MFMDRSLGIWPDSGRGRSVCGHKEPFAVLIAGNYAYIRMYDYYSGLKARYFVVNHTGSDGKLTLRSFVTMFITDVTVDAMGHMFKQSEWFVMLRTL